ncbi:unnamed protein product [Mytilus edulis]|uniref:CCHC-type domain-containing protein n=1 Tax=Mytilus edulis TaxID=6550 RepID=A0A8S3R0N4_MYTED|nr:unnamed protein product [Mytilus edulis]
MAAKIDLNPVGNFDVSGDRLGQSWTRWLRSFELYATGKGVDDKKQKKALLLHCAGLDVQDIYFTLTEEDGDDDFDKTIKTLKKHFDAKVNFSVERYNLRSIKQNETETIDQYITRLKQQVVLCDHADPDAQVRDQVIEKCRSNRLRTRLLEKGPGLTLDDVRTIARTLEMAEKHSREMEGATGYGNNPSSSHGSVNRVNQRKPTQYGQNKTKTKSGLKCYRCGREGHFGKDPSCPAQGKTCNKCGKSGHFGTVCKTKQGGQQNQRRYGKYGTKSAKGIVNYVESDDDEYAFIVKNQSDKNDAFIVKNQSDKNDEIEINAGGINIKCVIDSGASVNIISSALWEKLKIQKIVCKSEKSEKKLYSYGSETPLEVLGKFTCEINVKGQSESVEGAFYVVKGNSVSLLGKATAIQLDASNVGLGAVLVQENKGMSRVISYASRALSETEKKYSTTEKEGLAVNALKPFQGEQCVEASP